MRLFKSAAALLYALIASPLAGAQIAPSAARSTALEIMRSARYSTFTTVGVHGQPQSRIVDPLLGGDVNSMWIATNPRSRKVAEIRRNPRVSLLFFNAPKNEFVTVLGRATVVTDSAAKAKHWKPEWTPFYKGGSNGGNVTLFEVKPFQLEIVSPARGFKNDTITWRPVIVGVP